MSTPTILCVDDERNVLFALRAQLSRHFPNNIIEIAESAAEALNLVDELYAQGIEVPLVIADQIMPGMKGDEFLIELHARHPEIAKIMMTGQALAEDVGNVVNRGSLCSFIAKPWDETNLVLTVMEALRRYQQDQQLIQHRIALEQANQQLAQLNAELEQQVQKRTQQLQRNEQQLRLFVEYAPAAVAMVDREMRYLLVSRRWKTDYNLGDQEIIGRSHYEVFPSLPEHCRQVHQRCLAGASEHNPEDLFVSPDGTIIWVQWEIHPWYTEANEVGGLLLFSQVITDRKLAEQALQKSEANLKKAQAIAHIGNWEFDLATGQVYWSEELYQIHGHDPNQPILMGEEGEQYIYPDDRTKYQQEILEKVAVGEPFVTDLRILRTDGSIRFIEARGEPCFDPQDQLTGFRGTVQDITDRKQTEEALRESEERLRMALEAAHTGCWDWNILTNRIVWSESLERLMGIPSGSFDGRIETFSAMIHPDDRQRVMESIAQSIELDEDYYLEFRFVKPDGSIRWALSKGHVIRDQSGQAIRMIGVDVDITDRKQLEIELQESRTKLSEVLDSTIAGIVKLRFYPNGSFEYDYISPHCERIYDYTADELTAEPTLWRSRIHPDDYQDVFFPLMQTILSQTGTATYSIEYRFRRKDESIGWILANLWAQWDAAQGYWNVTLVDTDISDRKQAELALQESEIRFRELSDASPANIYILVKRIDGSFYCEHVSRAIEAILETPLAQIYQNPNLLVDCIHPEDRMAYENAVEGSLRHLQLFQHEWRVITPSGQIKWLQGSSCPRQRDNGDIAWYGVVIDITDRKMAQLALQQSETKFQELAAASPAIIFTLLFDLDGNSQFQYLSPAVEEVYEMPIADLLQTRQLMVDQIHPQDRLRHLQAIAHSLATLEPFQHEWRIVTPSEKIKWLNAYARAQRRPTGETIWQGIAIDVTDRKQAEIALAQEIARRKAFFDTSIDGIVVIDQAGNVLESNSSFAQMLGYSLEEMTTLNLTDFDAHWTYEEMGRKIDEHQLCENMFETRHRRKDGSIYDVEISSSALVWKDQSVQLCICRDITDRKQAEEALRQSEERWALAIEANNDGIWDHSLTKDTHFLSPRCLEILGYTYEEVNPFDKWLNYVHPEDRPILQTTFAAYLNREIPTYECEYRMRCKDGNYKWLLARGKAIWSETGRPIRVVGSLTDTTIRRQAELALHQLNEELEQRVQQRTQELARSEQDLRTIFNNVYDAVLIHALDGTILDANDRALELRGATREQLIGASVADLSAPDAPIASIPDYLQRAEAGETLRFEWKEQRFDDQSCFDVEVSLRKVTLGNRPVFVAGMRDISERKKYEAQLQRTNEELIHATRMKDDFLATMSHELRTPLNAILGMTESLQEGIFGEINARQLKALQTVELSSSHLLELINDILDFTKIDSSQMELVCAPTDVASLCQATLALIKPQALKKQIQLDLKLPPNLPALDVDERRIRQVLLNLLNNAVKFTPEGGHVTLKVSPYQQPVDPEAVHAPRQNFLRIAITDTGIGIAPEHLHRLFQPFMQIDSALNRKYGGTGLGLVLVKRIVELHGGQVGLTSEVGVGSCFTVDLPCTAPVPSLPLETQPELSAASNSPTLRASPVILLAEDNEANIITTANYLTAKGYQVLIARDGQEAISVTQTEHPDIILMDIQMPGIDGLEAIQQIRADQTLAEIPIIALTALAMPGDRDRCLTAGANLYLSKPVKLKQLTEMIEELLDPEIK